MSAMDVDVARTQPLAETLLSPISGLKRIRLQTNQPMPLPVYLNLTGTILLRGLRSPILPFKIHRSALVLACFTTTTQT